jgi:hypothetical protein
LAKKVDIDWAAFRALVVSGMSIRETARRLGVNPNTALQTARRQKWGIAKLHGCGHQPDIPKKMLARTQRTVVAGEDFYRQANGKTKVNLAKAVVSASKTLSDMPGQQILEQHQALSSVSKTASSVFQWDANHAHPHLSIQGVLFNFSPGQLAAKDGASFDELLQQYGQSHPVRELEP